MSKTCFAPAPFLLLLHLHLLLFLFLFLLLCAEISGVSFLQKTARSKPKVTIFGATGGLGQQACSILNKSGKYEIQAVTRDKFGVLGQLNNNPDNSFELLRGVRVLQANARELDEALVESVKNADHIIISVGTTAFPTSKWEGGNNPKAACIGKYVLP